MNSATLRARLHTSCRTPREVHTERYMFLATEVLKIRSDTFGNGRTASIFKSPRLLTAGHQKYMLLTTPQTTTTATTTATLCEEKKPEPKHTSKNLSSVSSATSCQRWWRRFNNLLGGLPLYQHSASGTVLRGVLFGGYAGNGANAGFGCAYSNNAPSNTYAGIGSRLCFIPNL